MRLYPDDPEAQQLEAVAQFLREQDNSDLFAATNIIVRAASVMADRGKKLERFNGGQTFDRSRSW